MSADDALGLLAEIAVAIAGFSSIVVVFGGRSEGRWSRADRARLSLLVGGSLAVLFFALFPSAIRFLHGGESITWGASSGLFATFLIAYNVWANRRMRGLFAFEPGALNPYVAISMLLLLAVALVLQVLNLVGPFHLESGPYVVGLVLLLMVSATQFVRLVFTSIDSSG
jgi:hypothetical protein